MIYQSNTTLSFDSHHVKRDEITIFQENMNSNTLVVFKGFLKPGGKIFSSFDYIRRYIYKYFRNICI